LLRSKSLPRHLALALKVQNATVFTPTAVRRTRGRVRWPSRERSLGPKLPLAPEASSALGERTFGNRQTKRLSSLTGLFGAPDGTRGPRDQSRGYSRLPKGLNIHRRPSALKAPRGRHSIAQGAATKRSPGSASHQKAPSKSPNGARQATLVGPACAASFADGRHAHGSLLISAFASESTILPPISFVSSIGPPGRPACSRASGPPTCRCGL
jgi:hypothetical protein